MALLLLARSAAAYDALVGWAPAEGAAGYTLEITYDEQAASPPVDLGSPPAESDGLLRVVVTDLPIGPTAAFTARAYDDLGQVSAPSETLTITYADAARVIDEDGDGLTTAEEDVDLDRVVDPNETDPRVADTDGDGIGDGDERRVHGTDPLLADTDADGYSDGDEIADGSDPNDASSVPDSPECTAADADSRCDDGNPCTDDYCLNGLCIRSDNTATCDDGITCTTGDRCDAGACRGVSSCDIGWMCDLGADRCMPVSEDFDNDGLFDFEDACPFDPANACFGTVATDGLTGKPVRINATPEQSFCSGARVDCRGERWHNDFGFVDAGRGDACSNGNRWGRWDRWGHCEIAAVSDVLGCESSDTSDVFRCAHSASETGGTVAYVFSVPPGRYLVNLYFANVRRNESSPGSQITDIMINGLPVYPGFDEVVVAGASSSLVVRSAYVTVSDDGDLAIELVSIVGRASINGLEVLSAATSSSF